MAQNKIHHQQQQDLSRGEAVFYHESETPDGQHHHLLIAVAGTKIPQYSATLEKLPLDEVRLSHCGRILSAGSGGLSSEEIKRLISNN